MGLTKSRFRAQLSTGIMENDHELIKATVEEMKHSEYDMDITVTPDGQTVYSLAIDGIYNKKVTVDTFKLLIKSGFNLDKAMESPLKFTPLYAALRRNQLQLVKLLLDAGADPRLGESTSEDPLFTACGMGYVDCVELLLKKGANPDSVSPGPGGTPMMLAVQTSHHHAPRIIRLLMEYGTNVKYINRVQRNGLHSAADCLADITDCTKILLDAGVDMNARDMFGQTPMHMAAIANRPKIITLLLEYGADTNVKSNEGETPLDVAYRMEHPEVIELLKNLTVATKEPSAPECSGADAGKSVPFEDPKGTVLPSAPNTETQHDVTGDCNLIQM